MNDTLITQTELSERLGVSLPTLLRWREDGIITPAVWVERTVRYNFDDVMEQLDNYRRKTDALRGK